MFRFCRDQCERIVAERFSGFPPETLISAENLPFLRGLWLLRYPDFRPSRRPADGVSTAQSKEPVISGRRAA
jgi:hypothetical protein